MARNSQLVVPNSCLAYFNATHSNLSLVVDGIEPWFSGVLDRFPTKSHLQYPGTILQSP